MCALSDHNRHCSGALFMLDLLGDHKITVNLSLRFVLRYLVSQQAKIPEFEDQRRDCIRELLPRVVRGPHCAHLV